MEDAADQWVVLELSPRSEGEDPSTIESSITKALPGAEVFIPAVVTEVGNDRKIHYLVDGYAFVRNRHPVESYVRLENTRYIQSVLSEPGGNGRARRLSTVPSRDIDRMRGQVAKEVHQGIGIGDKVLITTGVYRDIEATVVEEIHETQTVQVYVQLRSKQALVSIPRAGLRVLDRAPLSPAYTRLTALKVWIQQVRPVLTWQPTISSEALLQQYQEYARVSQWLTRGHQLYAFVSFAGSDAFRVRLTGMRERLDTLEMIEGWMSNGRLLHTFVSSYYNNLHSAQLHAIRGKLLELDWLDDVLRRVKTLRREVEAIGHRAAKDGDEDVVQNIVVDGHNLAFRCLYAPGMAALTAADGRPTGVVLGFLRSLGSLRKRHPDARLYVTWDGSSKRRKAVFGEYKGNRPVREVPPEGTPEGFDQVGFLVKILPLLGVRQVTNPDEEADDLIATLVRGPLKDQHNLIFSNDRDLLQLVSETTYQLVPGTGSRKEILFDVDTVRKTYGVPPGQMVQLRAFFGDTSDNIPGVPRVPKKVLTSLVKAHGSVEGVYNSGLTGLSKGQYERLRFAEPQVRINLTLMSLVDVPVSETVPDVDSKAAATQLDELGISAEPILEALFGKAETEGE